MKLHESDNWGRITVNMCAKSTCSHLVKYLWMRAGEECGASVHDAIANFPNRAVEYLFTAE